METTTTEPKLERLDSMVSGTVFRFPGCGQYHIKINAECSGNSIKAVCISPGSDDAGNVFVFDGEHRAISGSIQPALVHMGF